MFPLVPVENFVCHHISITTLLKRSKDDTRDTNGQTRAMA